MSGARFNQPLGGDEMTRAGGPATFMRLPAAGGPEGLDVAILGVPMDIGTSWRSGTRFGPRQIRAESAMLRPYNLATGAAPFERMQIADMGDVPVNPYSLPESLARIRETLHHVAAAGAVPVTLGGDHALTLAALRGVSAVHGPLAVIHVDAHADVNDTMAGMRETHGTVFRRAREEGLIVPARTFQIGLRGTGYGPGDFAEAAGWGFRQHLAHTLWHRSLAPLADEIRAALDGAPVYLSYDIDSIDPGFAPGTGTPESGGLTPMQAMELIRGLDGLRIVGADLVEVSPPYDAGGSTALLAANLVYEMLCILPAGAARTGPGSDGGADADGE